jgi:2-polyprenyl-6-methoxyphenol hydroxylase-like FAD-dependent oxidoreductase
MAARDMRVLIVGGSLVGLCSAIALARSGVRVTVLERTPQGHYEGGGGLGVDVGLLAEVTGLRESPPVCWGIDRATTAWPLLADWLEDHARRTRGIELRRGAEVVDTGDGWVQIAGGARYEAGVVIGADGARSTVRRSVAPEHPDAVYAGFLLWRAMVSESDLPAEILPAGDEPSREHYSGPYRLVTYPVPGADGRATRGHRRLNMVWYDPARSEVLTSNGLLTGSTVHGSLAAADVSGELREELRIVSAQNWPTPWREAMDVALRDSLVFATPVAQYRPERLVNGRIALAGDAAHAVSPMVGGGFRQGLYDAAALATAFQSHGDAAAALGLYERSRLSEAQHHVERSIAASDEYLERRGSL